MPHLPHFNFGSIKVFQVQSPLAQCHSFKNNSGSFETLADLKLLYVAKNNLELLILLSLSPDAGITSTKIHLVLGTKIRVPHTLGNHTIS